MKSFIISLIISICLINSSFAYSYYESGKAEFKKGNYAKANELFKNSLTENPENLKCRYFYAQSFIGINNLAKAQKEYEKVIEQSPNSELAKLASIAISRIHGYSIQKPKIILKTKSSNVINNTAKTIPDVKNSADIKITPVAVENKNIPSLPTNLNVKD